MLMTLELDIKLVGLQKELIDLGLLLANGEKDYQTVLSWINGHKS